VLTAGTIASFGGCVVTAFYLVLLSVDTTICISGMVIVAMGALVLVYTQLFKKSLFC
jgi:hypothetical protein